MTDHRDWHRGASRGFRYFIVSFLSAVIISFIPPAEPRDELPVQPGDVAREKNSAVGLNLPTSCGARVAWLCDAGNSEH